MVAFPYFKTFIKYIRGYGPEDWVETDRIVVQNFRPEIKGMGAAQFTIHPSIDGEITSTIIREIAVIDNRDGQYTPGDIDANLSRILFLGHVLSSSNNTFTGSNNSLGELFAEEYGLFLSKEAIYYDRINPNFNPYYDDLQYGNYDSSNFRNENFAQRNGVGTFWQVKNVDDLFIEISDDEELDQFVWNRKKIIEKLVSDSPFVGNVTFPFDAAIAQEGTDYLNRRQDLLDNDDYATTEIGPGDIPFRQLNAAGEERDRLSANLRDKNIKEIEESYKWFFDFDIGEISNYEGESLMKALIDLLPEPLDFYFDYTKDRSSPELIIINKSTVEVAGICPAGIIKNINIPQNYTALLNLNFRNEEIYDRVIVRSEKPILWCGSLTMWLNNLLGASLVPDWTQEEEEAWINGFQDDLPFPEADSTYKAVTRAVLDNVFQKFKWINGTPQLSKWALNTSEEALNEQSVQLNNFFGDFFGIDLNPTTGDKNVLINDPTINLNINREPNKMALEWEPFLPFSRYDIKQPDVIQYNLERDRWALPFVVSPVVRLEEPNAGQQYWIDRSLDFGIAASVEVSYHQNGIWVRTVSPQTNLSRAEELFRLSLNGTTRLPPQTAVNLEDVDDLEFNPENSEEAVEGYSSFWRYIITVAGRSDQYMEAYKWRRGPGGEIIQGEKYKVIEVPCEMWLVHPNTVRNVTAVKLDKTAEDDRDNLANGLIRLRDPTKETERNPNGVLVLRDDRKLLLQYLEAYSALLTNPRGELFLSLTIDRDYDLKIGDLIGSCRDGPVTYQSNSAIVSMEYSIEMGEPRINIKTSVASYSPIQKSLDEAHIAQGIRPRNHPNVAEPKLTPFSMPQMPRDDRIRRD